MKSVVGGDEVLLADLSRRAGAFEQAYGYCRAGLVLPELPAFMKRLLLFEQRLAVACVADCHTVAEVEAQAQPVGNRGGEVPLRETRH